VIDVTATAE